VGGSGAAGTAAGGTAVGAPAVGRRGVVAPIYVEAPDPLAPALGGAALGAVIFVLFGGLALTSAVLGIQPPLLKMVSQYSMLILLGIGVGISLLFAVIGGVIGKSVR
jgi:hypothetical protein